MNFFRKKDLWVFVAVLTAALNMSAGGPEQKPCSAQEKFETVSASFLVEHASNQKIDEQSAPAIPSFTAKQIFQGHSQSVTALKYFANNSRLLSASMDNSVRIWDAESATLLCNLGAHDEWVVAIDVFEGVNGAYAASASLDKTIKVWDLVENKIVRSLEVGHEVLAVKFLSQNRLLSDSLDGSIRIWDLNTGACENIFKVHRQAIGNAFDISTDKKIALVGCEDGYIVVFDLMQGICIGEVQIASESIASLCLSPKGSSVVACCGDGSVYIVHNIEHALAGISGAVLKIDVPLGFGVTCASYSPNSNYVALSLQGVSLASLSCVRIYDVAKGSMVCDLQGHSNVLLTLAFSSDGRELASGSCDNTIKTWDLSFLQ